jgi:PAS domain S-box-containing protein
MCPRILSHECVLSIENQLYPLDISKHLGLSCRDMHGLDTPPGPDVSPKVLLIDDHHGDARLLEQLLRDGFDEAVAITHAATLDEALHQLTTNPLLNLILLDPGSPDSQGIDTFEQILNAAPNLPVVVLIGSRDTHLTVELLRRGAQDYLDKNDLTSTLVAHTVRHALLRWYAELKRQEAEARLKTREAQLAVIAELGHVALVEPTLQHVFDHAVERVRQVLGVEYTKILELLPGGEQFLLRAGLGWQAGLVGQATVGTNLDSLAGYTLTSDNPVIVEDLRRDDRFLGPPLLLDHGVISGMSVVIRGQKRPFGILGTHTSRQQTFTQDDVHFLQAVANILADAVKRAETERHNAFQASLLEQVQTAVIATDNDGAITYWNSYAEALYQWRAEEVMGRHILQINVPEDAERIAAEIKSTLSENDRWEGEFTVKRKDGSLFPVLTTLTRTFDLTGHPLGIVGTTVDLTERKAAEEQYAWLLERYRLTAKATKDLLYDWTIPSDILRFSSVIHREYGHPLAMQDTSVTWWSERVHPEDRIRVDAEYDAFFESQAEAWTSEYRFQQADGSYKFVFDRGFLVRDKHGNPVRLVGAITDQTDWKVSEATLKESETRFRQLAENIQEAFWLTDANHNQMLYLSPAYETIWGRSRDEFFSQHISFLDTLHSDDRARIEAALFQQQVGGYSQEYRIIRPDGTVRWVHDKAFPVHNDAGKVYRIAGIAEDITERKHAQQALQESLERFELVSLATNDLIYEWDIRTDRTTLNQAAETLFGYPIREIEGKQWWPKKIHPDDWPGASRRTQEILRQGEQVHANEYRFQRADGTFAHVLDRGYLVRDEQGKPIRMIGAMTDLTDRKRVEEERKRLLQDLAERVKELYTLHQVSGLLRDEDKDLQALLDDLIILLPRGWKHPNATAVRIRIGELDTADKTFATSPWRQRIDFTTNSGTLCTLEVVYLDESSKDPFLHEEYEMLRSLGEMLRAYLDRRHAKEAIESLNIDLAKRVMRLDALRQIDMAITTSQDMHVTLSQVAHQVQRSLAVDVVDILLYEPNLHRLQRTASIGFRFMAGRNFYIDINETTQYATKVAIERKPVFVPDVRTADPPFSNQALLEQEGFVSHYAVPLMAKGTLHGVLNLFHRSPLAVNEDWQAFAQALALQAAIAIDSTRLLGDLQQANTDLALAYDATIEGWGRALDLKDEETAGHSRRVTKLTVRLAQRLGIPEEQLVDIRRGAILHDIGKMGVPDSILLKR